MQDLNNSQTNEPENFGLESSNSLASRNETLHVTPFGLYQVIAEYLTIADLITISMDLGINFREIPHDTLQEFARELVYYSERHNKIQELADTLVKHRPRLAKSIIVELVHGQPERIEEILVSRFNESEFRTLCFALGISFDSLVGQEQKSKVIDLLLTLKRNGRISDLVSYGEQMRPDINWGELASNYLDTLEREKPNQTDASPQNQNSVSSSEQMTSSSENQKGVFSHSKQLSNFIIDIKQIVDSLSDTEPEDFQKVAASQIELLSNFYTLVLYQARQSFRWAIIAAGIGLIFFIVSVTSLLLQQTVEIATVSIISGALVEFIASINFYLYNKATSQLSEFHVRLELTQRFLLGNSMCERLDGDFKQQTRTDLVRIMIGAEPTSVLSRKENDKPET